MNRAWIIFLLTACTRTRTLHARASVCGELNDAPSDLSTLGCAVAARLRVCDGTRTTNACEVLAGGETCTWVTSAPGSASQLRPLLTDIFQTPTSAATSSFLGLNNLDPTTPFYVEVALLAPGGALSRNTDLTKPPQCPPETQDPSVAVGRSRIFTPARDAADTIAVPLGARNACSPPGQPSPTQATVTLKRLDTLTKLDNPLWQPTGLVDVFPYEAFANPASSAGSCVAPPAFETRGDLRQFVAVTRDNATFSGPFIVDRTPIGGCSIVVDFGTDLGSEIHLLSCAFNPTVGQVVTFDAWQLTQSEVTSISAAQLLLDSSSPSCKTTAGALLVRVNTALNQPAEGATVTFTPTQNQPKYASAADATSVTFASGNTTTLSGLGLAWFQDAQSGPYVAQLASGEQIKFNAGAPEDCRSVTLIVVHP